MEINWTEGLSFYVCARLSEYAGTGEYCKSIRQMVVYRYSGDKRVCSLRAAILDRSEWTVGRRNVDSQAREVFRAWQQPAGPSWRCRSQSPAWGRHFRQWRLPLHWINYGWTTEVIHYYHSVLRSGPTTRGGNKLYSVGYYRLPYTNKAS